MGPAGGTSQKPDGPALLFPQLCKPQRVQERTSPKSLLCSIPMPPLFFFTSKFSSSNKSPPGEAGARAALRVCRGCSLQLRNIISPPRQLALPFFFFLLSNRVPSHFFDAAPFFPRCSQPAELLSPTVFLPVQHGAQHQPRTGPVPALPSPCSRPTPKFWDRV